VRFLPFRAPTFVLVALAIATATKVAAADDDKAAHDAQARFAEGIARVKKGEYEAARISFAQAYVVLHKPDILWNLALAEEKSGHPLEALGHFKVLTRDAEADVDRANAQKHVADLMSQTGHVDVHAPPGTLVTIDGVQKAGAAPFAEPIDVLVGKHVVVGRVGDDVKSVTVWVGGGETRVAAVGGEGPAATATATPTTTPTPTPTPTPTVTASGSAVAPPDVSDHSTSTSRIVTTAAVGAAGIVAIGVGVYFGLQSQSEGNTATGFRMSHPSSYCSGPSKPGDCSSWNDAVDAQNRDATISNVLYVSGGVLVAGAAAAWFLWPKARSEASAGVLHVTPVVGSTGAGAAVSGRF
jgi:tetratricopeptide (TPR) repeat protein